MDGRLTHRFSNGLGAWLLCSMGIYDVERFKNNLYIDP